MRRKRFPALFLIVIAAMSMTLGCGGSGNSSSKPTVTATSTVLSVNPVTPTYNTPVTLTANVTPMTGSGVPTGSVIFAAGADILGTSALANGTTTLHLSSIPIGQQVITATYSGDSNYTGSTSTSDSVDLKFTSTIVVTVADGAGNSSNASLVLTIQ